MAIRTRVWSAGKLLVLIGALIGTYLLFAAASMRLALSARQVDVPDLVGQTANQATAVAAERGLLINVDETRRPDPLMEAGRVVAQEPSAGTPLRRQRSVKVWLSAGLHAAVVPEVTGETERNAQMRLAQDGLTVWAISEIRAENYASDVVVAQNPSPPRGGDRVALLVNRGEFGASYVMPDLIGLNGDRATEVLRRYGFRVAAVASAPYPGVAAGIVLRQNPQAGFQIAPGEPISIEVSR